jgi:hypothetical protein
VWHGTSLHGQHGDAGQGQRLHLGLVHCALWACSNTPAAPAACVGTQARLRNHKSTQEPRLGDAGRPLPVTMTTSRGSCAGCRTDLQPSHRTRRERESSWAQVPPAPKHSLGACVRESCVCVHGGEAAPQPKTQPAGPPYNHARKTHDTPRTRRRTPRGRPTAGRSPRRASMTWSWRGGEGTHARAHKRSARDPTAAPGRGQSRALDMGPTRHMYPPPPSPHPPTPTPPPPHTHTHTHTRGLAFLSLTRTNTHPHT